jgi:hypothetical protein
MGRLKLEILCYRLRILVRVDINNLETTHFEDVYAMIAVRGTVDNSVLCGPSHDDRGVMGRSLYPNVKDGKSESRSQASETLEPAAKRHSAITLTAQGVRPVKAMMNVGDASLSKASKSLWFTRSKFFLAIRFTMAVIHVASPSEFNCPVHGTSTL